MPEIGFAGAGPPLPLMRPAGGGRAWPLRPNATPEERIDFLGSQLDALAAAGDGVVLDRFQLLGAQHRRPAGAPPPSLPTSPILLPLPCMSIRRPMHMTDCVSSCMHRCGKSPHQLTMHYLTAPRRACGLPVPCSIDALSAYHLPQTCRTCTAYVPACMLACMSAQHCGGRGPEGRCGRGAGQGLIQFARGTHSGVPYAMKFCITPSAFNVERAVYGNRELAHVVPRVASTVANSDGALSDPDGTPLPPCIVVERGRALDDWAARHRPDVLAVAQVPRPLPAYSAVPVPGL